MLSTSEPLATKYSTTLRWPSSIANILNGDESKQIPYNAVLRWLFWMCCEAPPCNKHLHVSKCPAEAARWSGVLPACSVESGFAPALSSSSQTFLFPLLEARCSGVQPMQSLAHNAAASWSGFKDSVPKSKRTISMEPTAAAMWSGVHPEPSGSIRLLCCWTKNSARPKLLTEQAWWINWRLSWGKLAKIECYLISSGQQRWIVGKRFFHQTVFSLSAPLPNWGCIVGHAQRINWAVDPRSLRTGMTDAEDLGVCGMLDDSCSYDHSVPVERRSSQEHPSYAEFCREAIQTLTSLAHSLSLSSTYGHYDFFSIPQFLETSSGSRSSQFSVKRPRSSQRTHDSPSKKRVKIEQACSTYASPPSYVGEEFKNEYELIELFQLFHERLIILQSNMHGRSAIREIHEFFDECLPSLSEFVNNPPIILQFVSLLSKCAATVGKESLDPVKYFTVLFYAYLSLLEKQVKMLHNFTDAKAFSFSVILEIYGKAITMFSPLISLIEFFKPLKCAPLQSICREFYQNFLALAFTMVHHVKELYSKSRHSSYALGSLCHAFLQSLILSLSPL